MWDKKEKSHLLWLFMCYEENNKIQSGSKYGVGQIQNSPASLTGKSNTESRFFFPSKQPCKDLYCSYNFLFCNLFSGFYRGRERGLGDVEKRKMRQSCESCLLQILFLGDFKDFRKGRSVKKLLKCEFQDVFTIFSSSQFCMGDVIRQGYNRIVKFQ